MYLLSGPVLSFFGSIGRTEIKTQKSIAHISHGFFAFSHYYHYYFIIIKQDPKVGMFHSNKRKDFSSYYIRKLRNQTFLAKDSGKKQDKPGTKSCLSNVFSLSLSLSISGHLSNICLGHIFTVKSLSIRLLIHLFFI